MPKVSTRAPKVMVCRDDGGGGNRTRVGRLPDRSYIQDFRRRVAEQPTLFEDAPTSMYVIREVSAKGPVKIGLAIDPEERILSLQGGNARMLELLFCLPGTKRFEQFVHAELADSRIRPDGEWFHWTTEVDYIVSELLSLAELCEDINRCADDPKEAATTTDVFEALEGKYLLVLEEEAEAA